MYRAVWPMMLRPVSVVLIAGLLLHCIQIHHPFGTGCRAGCCVANKENLAQKPNSFLMNGVDGGDHFASEDAFLGFDDVDAMLQRAPVRLVLSNPAVASLLSPTSGKNSTRFSIITQTVSLRTKPRDFQCTNVLIRQCVELRPVQFLALIRWHCDGREIWHYFLRERQNSQQRLRSGFLLS